MKNINHLIDIARQSHQHMPALLSLLLGLIIIKKNPSVFFSDDEAIGDNIPVTLMECIRWSDKRRGYI